MGRPVHFEIQSDDLDRARDFYTEVFGWAFEDYSDAVGYPYWGVLTGAADTPGIDGGLLQRPAEAPGRGESANAWVITVQVDSYDATMERILAHGGEEVKAKYALPGMAWQGYYTDPDGNTFGIHEADTNAK